MKNLLMDLCGLGERLTPFFLLRVPVGKRPIGVVFGILRNGGVVRVNVATLNRVAVWISRTITRRLDLMSGSSLGFRLRPHNRRDPKPRRDRQTGNQKKACVPGRREYKIQATTGPDHVWPGILSGMSGAAQRKEKQQWAFEKPKLVNALKVREHLFYRSGREGVQGNHS